MKDNKSDTKKKDKPDTMMKDNKPDTKKKDNIENRVSNSINYEIEDIAKYRKVLIKMIDERTDMLDIMNMELSESREDTNIEENIQKFGRLCSAKRIKFAYWYMLPISRIYAVNVALERLRDSAGNGIWPKDVNCNIIALLGEERSVQRYYKIVTLE